MRPPQNPAAQEQFLKILSREEAVARFDAALGPIRPQSEMRPLAAALGARLAEAVKTPSDVPPFDRSNVDGFAARSADLASASAGAPVVLRLNPEEIACGRPPRLTVAPGTATLIATGGRIPRGADAVVMVEQTDPAGEGLIEIRRAPPPGGFVSFAGSDMARGETLFQVGTALGAREIGMLAACGIGAVRVIRPPRAAVISTGDELVQPGEALGPGQIHDANGPMIAAAVCENGGEGRFLGAFPDDEAALEAAMRAALEDHDLLILSGGTSKGTGDLTHRILARLGEIVAHGVALKPGKPLCLAVCGGKPAVILPGFPTSAMFTFHDVVAPVLRRMAGLPPRDERKIAATTPLRIPSELGRTEFVMVSLAEGPQGPVAYPTGKGSGAVTSFAQADGFLRVEALADHLPAGARAEVALLSPHLRAPDLTLIGSHCLGLDVLAARLARERIFMRSLAVGSLGGLAAARRGECDLAPIHLLDPETGVYNAPFLSEGLELVPGWLRMQGLVFRKGDPRFEGRNPEEAVRAALEDPSCLMVNRNAGAGTRILIDGLLKGARPEGYWNQPRSHNAVAAAVVQERADWGVAISTVAEANDLGFLPLAEERYDFALAAGRRERPAVRAFLEALASAEIREALAAAGFLPRPPESRTL